MVKISPLLTVGDLLNEASIQVQKDAQYSLEKCVSVTYYKETQIESGINLI